LWKPRSLRPSRIPRAARYDDRAKVEFTRVNRDYPHLSVILWLSWEWVGGWVGKVEVDFLDFPRELNDRSTIEFATSQNVCHVYLVC
jgi:hypothetical protein